MPPKRAAVSKRKAAAVEDDAAPAAASSKAASRSAKKQGGSKGAKAARKSKDADAEDEEDGAAAEMADTAPSSSSSSAAAASVPAPKLKGKAAKFAAALAASASVPINRCDADSISVVFSFLNTREFLAAIAVNKAFRAARMKLTAWPAFNLESLTQSLRDDNYSDSSRRRLDIDCARGSSQVLRLGSLALGRSLEQVRAEDERVSKIRKDHASAVLKAAKSGAPKPTLPADVDQLLTTAAKPGSAESCPSMWRHVTDVRLRTEWSTLMHFPLQREGLHDLEVALLQLSLLPCVSAINISAGRTDFSHANDETKDAPSKEVVRQMYERLAEGKRVQAMLLFCCSWPLLEGVTLLSSTLRVLVLDRQPSASIVSALVNLAYLHFERHHHAYARDMSSAESAELGMSLRWLSVSHSLRSLSVANHEPFYAAGLDLVLVPPFFAGANAEQGGPATDTERRVAETAARLERARPVDSTLPRVDWSKPCGLTDITLTEGMYRYQQSWLLRLLLVRLQLGPKDAPERTHYDWPTYPLEPPHGGAALANLQVLRWEMSQVHGSGDLGIYVLRHCKQLRVLQLSVESRDRGSRCKLAGHLLGSVLRSNADTLEELRFGEHLSVEWNIEAPPPPQLRLFAPGVASGVGFGAFGAGFAPLAPAAPAAAVNPFTPVGFGSFGAAPAAAGDPFAAAAPNAVAPVWNAFAVADPVADAAAAPPVAVGFAGGLAAPAAAPSFAVPSAVGFAAPAGAPSFAFAAASDAPLDIPAQAARDMPSLLQCTKLRVLQMHNGCWMEEKVLGALACLPAFHTLELIITSAQFKLPSNLAACVSHSRSWINVCLALHEESLFNLLRVSGGLNKLLPPEQLSESAVHRLRVYAFKEGKRQVLAVQTDKKGARKWASIEGPFATAVV